MARSTHHSGMLAAGALVLATVAACGGEDELTGPPTGLQPSVAAVSPDTGNVGTAVQVTGSNFETGAGVAFGTVPADSVVVVDQGALLAYAPAGLTVGTAYDITVANPGGKTDQLAAAYKVVSPALLAVNGVTRPSGNTGSTVVFEGAAFGDLLGLGTVFFTDAGGQPVAATVALPANWTNEFIVTTVPSSAESGPVWVETPTGATDSVEFRLLQSATFSPSLINWTPTTALPAASQGHGAVFLSLESGPGAGQLVYVTGGADGAMSPRSDVSYAEVDGSGALSAWTSVTPLPQPRAFHGTALATPFNALVDTTAAGHLYVVGGVDAAGPSSVVYHSVIDFDRTAGAWATETPLPVPLHSMGLTVYRSWLYVTGGATTANAPVAEVYRARIQEDGTLGTWESLTPLPFARSYAPLVQFAGVLYVMGGETDAVAPEDAGLTATRTAQIHFNPLDLRTAELRDPAWTENPGELIKADSKHSAVVAGGWVLVSGGLYNGSGSSSTEHQFAAFNADGTVGSFGGATGSQTIASVGGVAFFNHAALAYVDAAGEARVLVLGGADVNDPATPVGAAYYY